MRVITYGTFDLFHKGHYNILKRAKELGDYLIVGVTSESYDKARGKLNVTQSLVERIENVKNSGLVDEIIVIFLIVGEAHLAAPLSRGIIQTHFQAVLPAGIHKFFHHIALAILPGGLGYGIIGIFGGPISKAVMMLAY